MKLSSSPFPWFRRINDMKSGRSVAPLLRRFLTLSAVFW